MSSRSRICSNHLESLLSIKDACITDPKKALDVLEKVTSWSKLLREAKSDPDEVPFLHALAVTVCLIDDESSLERSPNISLKSLSNFYEKVDQERDAHFLPLLKPLTDRIEGRDADSVDLDEEGEDRPSRLIVNVDELKDLASSGDEATKQALMKLMKSPAVARKKRRVIPLQSDRPIPTLSGTRAGSDPDPQKASSQEENPVQQRLVSDLLMSRSTDRSSQPHANQSGQVWQQFPEGQRPVSAPPQGERPRESGPQYAYPYGGYQPPNPQGGWMDNRSFYQPPQHAQHGGGQWYGPPANYYSAPPPYQAPQQFQPAPQPTLPGASWGANALAYEKKSADPSTRSISAIPAVTLVVGESKSEIQLLLPRHFTNEGLVRGLKSKNEKPRNLAEYLLASQRVATAVNLAAYPVAYRDYNNYLTHMVGLTQVFEWDSVMNLDEEFRREQVLSGLAWAPPPPSMSTLILRYKSIESSKPTHNSSRPEKKKNVCMQWNRGPCTYTDCKFAHSCSLCSENHKAIQCPKANSTQMNSSGASGARSN